MRRHALLAAVVAALALGLAARATVARSQGNREVRVIRITARKFEYAPDTITLEKGVPVDLELTSLDRRHGFEIASLGIRADIQPGEVTRIRLVPQQTGRFVFSCDVFCGDGHEEMSGVIVVE